MLILSQNSILKFKNNPSHIHPSLSRHFFTYKCQLIYSKSLHCLSFFFYIPLLNFYTSEVAELFPLRHSITPANSHFQSLTKHLTSLTLFNLLLFNQFSHSKSLFLKYDYLVFVCVHLLFES